MLALDQRESLRTMLAPRYPGGAPDDALTTFKIEAARILSPHASAVLLDEAFGLWQVLAAGALAPDRGLIVAADRLTQAPGGPVEWSATDESILADDRIANVANAYKLLVIWRAGSEKPQREQTVQAFLDACRRRDRPGIVEGIVRPEPGQSLADEEHADLVIEAARELGALGPHLYKAEVPTLGKAEDERIERASRALTAVLRCPWVVLSNGTNTARFPSAALAACRGGASGFLAGRAIWQSAVTVEDPRHELETVARDRLQRLAEDVDGAARPWRKAYGTARIAKTRSEPGR
jgi:sulfofructosephosphate aldolase